MEACPKEGLLDSHEKEAPMLIASEQEQLVLQVLAE
jgi:hypothetical protein